MANREACLKNARIIDPGAELCAESLCETVRENIYRFCNCLPPNPPQNPCPYGPNTPVPVFEASGQICYCCCSDIAWDAPVAVPGGDQKPIQTLAVGDRVLAAGPGLNWTARKIAFSDGLAPDPGQGKAMISIYYQLPQGVSALVVTPDHVFLLADGTLRRAQFLVPGTDSLTAADGKPVALLAIEVGGWSGGVHHIATSGSPADGAEGHLLSMKGIVAGDWALQMSDIEDDAIAGAAAKNDRLDSGLFSHAVKGAEWAHARHEQFRPYGRSMAQAPEEATLSITR